MKTAFTNQFDGGMVNDPRAVRENVARTIVNFDAFTNPHKLTPYRSSATADASASSHQIGNYVSYGGTLYGLGVLSTQPRIYSDTDLTATTWTDYHSGISSVGSGAAARTDTDLPAFVNYHGVFYLVNAGRYVWGLNPTAGSLDGISAATLDLNNGDLTAYTIVSNFIVHSKDDILYLGYDNKIAKKNAATWTAAALTLPSRFVITCLSEYGNYLAIACRTNDGTKSRVFLWDRDSSVATLAESIDWGEGDIRVLEELEGYLIGVSSVMTNTFTGRLVFRYYAGAQGAVKFDEFIGTSNNVTVSLFHQKANNRIFFPALVTLQSVAYQGIWSVGRSSSGVPFAVTFDRPANNDTALTNPTLYGFILTGDYLYQSYLDNSVYGSSKTNSSPGYTATSIYETTVNPQMPPTDRAYSKKLYAVAVTYEALPSGGQVVLKYRVDGGAWITAYTETTTGAMITEQVLTAAGTQFTNGREFEFRVESTGGAIVTGLFYKYDFISTLL